MSENKDEFAKYFILIFASVYFIVLYYFAHKNPDNTSGIFYGHNYNVSVFIISVLLFIIFASIIYFFLKDKQINNVITNKNLHIISILYAIGFVIFLISLYVLELTSYNGIDWCQSAVPKNKVNSGVFLIIIAVILICANYMIKKIVDASKAINKSKAFRIAISIPIIITGAFLSFIPNVFGDNDGGLHHLHAFDNSIINICNFVPYSDVNRSIYGHYGLIYLPFVKLFGNNYLAVSITIALAAATTYFCAIYLLGKIINNDIWFGISAFALLNGAVTFFYLGDFIQKFPNRFVFPFICIAFMVFSSEKNIAYKWSYLIELILGILSIINNTESGIVIVLIIALIELFSRNYHIILKLFNEITYIILCFFGAYSVINLYNIACGGKINSIKTFIYPIGSTTYVVSNLRLPLPKVTTLFIFEIVLFSFVGFIAFINLNKKNAQINKTKDIALFSFSLFGLGMMTYFINRASENNLIICHLQMIMIIAILGENSLALQAAEIKNQDFSYNMKFFCSKILYFLILWLCLENMINLGGAIQNRDNSAWCYSIAKDSSDIVCENIPEDTVCFGSGIPELLFYNGRQTNCNIRDWSDMDEASLKELEKTINNADAYLTNTDSTYTNDNFELKDTIKINDVSVNYYVRKQ